MIKKLEFFIDATQPGKCAIGCMNVAFELGGYPAAETPWPKEFKQFGQALEQVIESLLAEIDDIQNKADELEARLMGIAVDGGDPFDTDPWGPWRVHVNLVELASGGARAVRRLERFIRFVEGKTAWFYVDESRCKLGRSKATLREILATLADLAAKLDDDDDDDEGEEWGDEDGEDDGAEAGKSDTSNSWGQGNFDDPPRSAHDASPGENDQPLEDYFLFWVRHLSLPVPAGLDDLERVKKPVFKAAHPDTRPGNAQAHHEFIFVMQGYALLKARLGGR